MKALLAIALAAASTGCATSSSTYTQDGRQGHSINCSGAALSWNLCYEKAGSICGSRGYDILARSGENSGQSASATSRAVFVTPMVSRSMVIACK